MSSKVYIRQNVDASIAFWGAGDFHATKTAEAPKLRLMEVHPTKSLVLAADRDGKVMLWDYEQHQTILSTTCALLLLDKINATGDKNAVSPSTGSHARLTARSNNRMTGGISNKPSIASTLSYRTTSAAHPIITLSNYAPAVLNKMKQQIGQILQVCFADAAYMRSCAGPGAYAHRSLPSSRSSETRIAIVCENALIFHDYATKATTALTSAELGRANPTSVEMINAGTYLVGCSDGLIRAWDEEYAPDAHQYSASSSGAGSAVAPVPAGGVTLTLNTHSKCEVTAIKAVPIRNPSEAEDVEQHKLRFVSVAADGQCLVWELLAGQLSASSLLPLARIKESLGTGISRGDLVFDPETNALLVCASERKIRMWDFEDLSAMSTLSGSMHTDTGGGVSSSVHGSISSSVHGGGGGGSAIGSSTHGGGFLGSSTHGGGGFLGSSTHGGSKGGIRSSMGLGKRGGLSAIIGGGADPLAAVFSLKSVGALQPERGLSAAYGRVASFCLVQHPYFSTGTYVLASKGNTFAIVQDKDSSGGMDEESSTHSASAAGAAPDKAAPLYLIQEFSLRFLMERYFATNGISADPTLLPAVGDALRLDALDAAAKVYAVRPHPHRPDLMTVLTSVGVLILTFGRLPAGSAFGVHPNWGAMKLIQTNDAIVQKILCALPSSDASDAAAGQAVEICPEILEDCGALEHTGAGSMGRHSMSSAASFRKRPGSKRSVSTGASGLDAARSSCRPVFHPSPSGTYCAVHWSESTVYVVIKVGAAVTTPTSPSVGFDAFGTGSKLQAASTSPVVEVDRGHCLEFGWIGTDDSFLIKTPPTVNSANSAQNKNKRASVSNLIFGAHKGTSLLFPSQLVLKTCVADGSGAKATEQTLHMSQLGVAKGGNTGTPLIQPALVVNIFGGPVLNMNTLNAKESDALLTAAAQARRAQDAAAAAAVDPKRQGPAGVPTPSSTAEAEHEEGPKVIEDVDATVRELRSATPPATSKQISTFFTVVSGKWLRLRQAQEAAAAASALAAKDKGGKKPRRTSVLGSGNDAAATEEDKPEASDSALQLVAVGTSMQRAEAVRWDFARNQCAILQTGSSAVTIMRLHAPAVTPEDHGYAQLSLQALCSVDVCYPTSLHPPVCGLTWCDGMLFVTSSGAPSIQLTFFSSPAAATTTITAPSAGDTASALFADTCSLPNCSPYFSGRAAKGVVENPFSCGGPPSPLATTEALGLHDGVVYTCTRDGTVYGVPVAASKVLPSLLQTGGSVEISMSLTSAQREAALAVLLHRGATCNLRNLDVGGESDLQVCVEEMKFTEQITL